MLHERLGDTLVKALIHGFCVETNTAIIKKRVTEVPLINIPLCKCLFPLLTIVHRNVEEEIVYL